MSLQREREREREREGERESAFLCRRYRLTGQEKALLEVRNTERDNGAICMTSAVAHGISAGTVRVRPVEIAPTPLHPAE